MSDRLCSHGRLQPPVASSKIIIKGGEFRQIRRSCGRSASVDLIYADGQCEDRPFEGGTFKCGQPGLDTLNCNRFCNDALPLSPLKAARSIKFDPSNVTVGEGEIFIADGYHVVQNGDWYTVVKN